MAMRCKGVALTADGREFLKYARQMQNIYEKMARIGRQSRLQFVAVSSGLTSFNKPIWYLPRTKPGTKEAKEQKASQASFVQSFVIL